MSLESSALRAILAKLESDLIASGERLVAADTANQAATRKLILAPDDKAAQSAASVAQSEQNAARQSHEFTTSTLLEAERMLAEILASEEATRIEALQAEVRALVPSMLEAAREADENLARYLGSLDRARKIEAQAHRTLEKQLNRPVFGGGIIAEAISDAANHIRAVRNGNADPLGPLTSTRADAAARRIASALGEG